METAAFISLLAALTIATMGWLLTSMRAEARAGQRAMLAELQALRAEVQANRQAITDLGVRLDGRIDEVIARFDDRFEVEGKRLDDIGKRFDDRFEVEGKRLDDIGKRFDDRFEVEGKRLDDMGKRFEVEGKRLDGRLDDVGKRLDDLYGILRTILDQLVQPARPDQPGRPAQH